MKEGRIRNMQEGDYVRDQEPRLSLKTYHKNFFFLFSRTNSLERAFLPSNTIQAFSVVEASSVLAVVVAISYSGTMQRDSCTIITSHLANGCN